MPRPAFDLGLWALCTSVSAALFAVPALWNVADHGLTKTTATQMIVAACVGVVCGTGLQLGLNRGGLRLSGRRRPDQAEDYGDRS